jgi:hypothetical protein
VCELDTTAAHIWMIGRDQVDPARAIHRRAGFRNDVTIDGHLAGENHRSSPFARLCEAVFDDEYVKAFFRFGHDQKL